MNNQQRAAMQKALDWIDWYTTLGGDSPGYSIYSVARTLREALAQPQDNLNCKSVQARLATLWGYVKAQPQDKGENNDVSAMADVEQNWMGSGAKDGEVAQPQGEWVDLTWDDYLELAGQDEFYVKDPHTGVMDFCSHEFTKAAIAKFKEKQNV